MNQGEKERRPAEPNAEKEEKSPQSLKERHFNRKVSEWNFKTFLLLGILVLLATKIIFDFSGFRSFLGDVFDFVVSLLSYLIFGFVLAYVLNAYMMWLERKPLKRMRPGRGKRYLSIVLAYVTLIAFIVFLIFAIAPKLMESIGNLAKMVPDLFDKVYQFYLDVVERGRFNLSASVQEGIVSTIESIKNALLGLLNVDIIASVGKRILTATGTGIFNAVMGILVSVYMLLEKDEALRASKRIVHGVFKPSRADRIMETGRKIDMIFKQYFTGKLMQALVILILSCIVLVIGNVNYAILFAVILGITNLIPYIGPWIGAIPTILVSLIQDPWMGIRALICVLVIQMLDNWFITPRVVGGKMGASPLLVLIGLCVGGTLFGFVGMIIGDVLAAIVKVLFYDSFIAGRLKKRVVAGELSGDYLVLAEEEEKKPGWLSTMFARLRNSVRSRKK